MPYNNFEKEKNYKLGVYIDEIFFNMLSSEIRNSINLIYFLFLIGNAGYVCASVLLFVWIQSNLDVTPHVPVPSNRDFTFQ